MKGAADMLKKFLINFIIVFLLSGLIGGAAYYWENIYIYSGTIIDVTISVNNISDSSLNNDDEGYVKKITQAVQTSYEIRELPENLSNSPVASFSVYSGAGIKRDFLFFIKSIAKNEGYIYNTDEEKLFRLTYSGFQSLMEIDSISAEALFDDPPQISLTANGVNKIVSADIVSGKWAYVDKDGDYNEKYLENQSRSSYAYINSDVSDIKLMFSENPDNYKVYVYDAFGAQLSESDADAVKPLEGLEKGHKYQIKIQCEFEKTIDRDYFGEVFYMFFIRL